MSLRSNERNVEDDGVKKIGLCSVTFRELPPEEVVKLAKKNGVELIEWGGDIHVPQGNYERAKEVKALTEKYGLECLSYGSYYRFSDGEDFEVVSKTAEILGSKIIRIWAGWKDAEEVDEIGYQALLGRLKECVKIAESRGQLIAFEFHPWTYCNYAKNVLKLLQDVNANNLYTYWQPKFRLRGRTHEELLRHNEEEIRLLMEKILNVHVYAWKDEVRNLLATDTEEWERYIEILGDRNYYIEFVQDGKVENFESDCKTLKKLLQK